MVMYFKNKKINKAVLTSATNGTMYPLDNLKEKTLRLNTFFWVEKERPKSKNDLFTVYPKIIRPKGGGIESVGSSDSDVNSLSTTGNSENQNKTTTPTGNSSLPNSRNQPSQIKKGSN